MGHFLKVDLADYLVQDGFNTLDPSEVALEYQVNIFSNMGVSVAEEKRTLTCSDKAYITNCQANRGYIFLGWNYTSKDGAKVGTGAYVTMFHYRVKVKGKAVDNGNLVQTLGILRKN